MSIVKTNNRWYRGIANAIRSKNESANLYRPDQMADAIRALTVCGILDTVEEPDYGTGDTVVLTDDTHYNDIASAIREKNESETQYLPEEMALAIMAFEMEEKFARFLIWVSEEHKNFTKLEVYSGVESAMTLVCTYTKNDYSDGLHNSNWVGGIDTDRIFPLGWYTFRAYDGGKIQDLSINAKSHTGTYIVHVLQESWPLA